MKIIEGVVATPYARIAIVISRDHYFINQRLLQSAVDVLKRIGQVVDDNITVVYVPRTYELPLAACCLTKQGDYDAIIALGCIIQSETAHLEYVVSECSRGLAQIAPQAELPVTCGVLVVESVEQAIEHAGIKANKGAEAALSTLEMINVLQMIKS